MSNKMDRPLVTVDGRTLMDRPLEPPNFVVDTLISQGLHILAGSPKVGKSWLALWLAVTVAKGEPVWGMSVKQGTTLYLCLEDSVLRIQNRLFEITEDAPDSVHFCTECAPIGQGLEEQVEGFLVAHPDTVLVLVDTLQMVRPVHDATYANDYRDLSMLKRLADKHGIAIINDCMRHASNREEFIVLMESEGYKVRWEKSRKNITYTTPSGWQCRDRLLFGDKYLKENMEYEFRIREEIIYGRAHGPEPARAFTAADSAGVEFTDHAHCHPVSAAGGSDDADTEDRIHRVGSAWNAGVSSEPEITHRPDSGAEQHGEDPEIVDGDDHSAGTGWEEERKAFLQMAGLASGLRPDRSGQMDRTGTAHRGGTAGDGVWHSDSGQQHPQPVSMKPLHAGLYGLAVTGALLDDGNEDVEECYRRIQAEQEAKNIGAVIGLVAGVAMVLTQDEQSSTEQQWTEDQQAEQTQQQTM